VEQYSYRLGILMHNGLGTEGGERGAPSAAKPPSPERASPKVQCKTRANPNVVMPSRLFIRIRVGESMTS
jgi:hypothetical protein